MESSIRGYHAYHKDTKVIIGEVMECEVETDPDHDKFAVIVQSQDGKTVGHVPAELSRQFHKFLINFGEIEAECVGNRYNSGFGKGSELPVDCKLFGKEKHLKDVVVKLKKIQNSEQKHQ